MLKVKIPKIEGVLIEFRCETCREWHKTAEEAQACYKRGIATQVVPQGSIIALNDDSMCFVVAEFHLGNYKHGGSYLLWGFRDTQAGDNTGDREFCGDELMHVEFAMTGDADPRYYPLPESRKWLMEVAESKYTVNTKTPAFARAVAFCKEQGLKPQYWTGSKFKKV